MQILEAMTISPDLGEIRRRLHMTRGKEWRRVCDLVENAWPMIEPKAVYRARSITSKNRDSVKLGRIYLKSRVLRQQLDNCAQAFPYVVTIGSRLEDKIRASDDILEQYYLDSIGNVALSTLLHKTEEQIRRRFGFACISSMAPGSLEDWPLEEQGPLFSIIGDVNSAIGVKLTDVLLMIPTKSESGIFYPTREKFFSCQLCPRKGCMNRKTSYDEKAAAEIQRPS